MKKSRSTGQRTLLVTGFLMTVLAFPQARLARAQNLSGSGVPVQFSSGNIDFSSQGVVKGMKGLPDGSCQSSGQTLIPNSQDVTICMGSEAYSMKGPLLYTGCTLPGGSSSLSQGGTAWDSADQTVVICLSGNLYSMNPPPGKCGTANGGYYVNPPTANQCTPPTVMIGSGWNWQCTDDSTVSCGANPLVCGAASANPSGYSAPPTSGLCSSGALPAVTGGTTTWTWACTDPTGASVACQAQTAGACGTAVSTSWPTAPTTGLCSAGTASAVSQQSGGVWAWTCSGSAGAPASCTATNGCGPASGVATSGMEPTTGLCSIGSASQFGVQGDAWTWYCDGGNVSCSASCPAGDGMGVIYHTYDSNQGVPQTNYGQVVYSQCCASGTTLVQTYTSTSGRSGAQTPSGYACNSPGSVQGGLSNNNGNNGPGAGGDDDDGG